MPYCKKCGKKTEEDDAYCTYCGNPVELPILSGEQLSQLNTQPRSSRIRIAEITVILFIVIISAVIFLHQTYPSALTPQLAQNLTSIDWSGYSVSTDLKNPQPKVTAITATWTVPNLSSTRGYTYSAAWVGIGGQFDQTLIQAGTQHNSLQSSVSYSAWYELLPDLPVTINQMIIKPGDKITVMITLSNSLTNTWSIIISDITTGQTYQTNVVYESEMLSAEWVMERPTVGNRVISLADFGALTFTGCSVTIGGKAGSIASFPSSKFNMINRQNIELVSVSPIGLDGASFSVAFLSPN